jgi:hypothetical protein
VRRASHRFAGGAGLFTAVTGVDLQRQCCPLSICQVPSGPCTALSCRDPERTAAPCAFRFVTCQPFIGAFIDAGACDAKAWAANSGVIEPPRDDGNESAKPPSAGLHGLSAVATLQPVRASNKPTTMAGVMRRSIVVPLSRGKMTVTPSETRRKDRRLRATRSDPHAVNSWRIHPLYRSSHALIRASYPAPQAFKLRQLDGELVPDVSGPGH